MVLTCQNISKAFGTDEIIKNASFHIEENEKTAIVGINGAGKSTLLKIIMNEITADSGMVTIAKDKTIGYLAQHQVKDLQSTIYEEVLSVKKDLIAMEHKLRQMEDGMSNCPAAEMENYLDSYNRMHHLFEELGGYTYRSEVTGVLKGLGFEENEFDKKMEELSGGQKTRVSLGCLLVQKPDIILLDEPTNHLDIQSIAWLETFLMNYRGAVIIVSHDRYFLDRVVTKVVELFHHEAFVYLGNYSEYAKKKEDIRHAQLNQFLNQQKEIKHQEEVITKLKSFNREKSIKRAESREKMLDKIVRLEKPVEENTDIHIRLEPNILSGNDVLTVENLSKSFDLDAPLFQNLDFEIKRGERMALIGNNGTGKTTILKIINNLLPPNTGKIVLGANVHIGYYDQEHHVLHMEKTIFDEIMDDYPNLNNTQVRNILAAFLFTGDDVFKKIRDLSGGERGRVSLAKLMLSEANFLILDEPTNHLDITSKEILESALNQYTGTVFFVSHDRYFINKTATRILELTQNTVINYIGNYDYYVEKRELQQSFLQKEEKNSELQTEEAIAKIDWEQQKKEQAKTRKKENAIKKVEEDITKVEKTISTLEEKLSDSSIASNSAKLSEITSELVKNNDILGELYQKWEELSLE